MKMEEIKKLIPEEIQKLHRIDFASDTNKFRWNSDPIGYHVTIPINLIKKITVNDITVTIEGDLFTSTIFLENKIMTIQLFDLKNLGVKNK